ncbi:MAG: gamma-glutamylcyclotransferase family protein [Aquisalimonadaceae bacterium]
MAARELYYFAYGSNMHPARLRERTPSCRRIGVARLPGHVLRFHHLSVSDGSGKCNVVETGHPDDVVYGVVYGIPPAERRALDAAENLGVGYRIRHMTVQMGEGQRRVFCYIAVDGTINDQSRPYCWYRDIVLHGARQHAFPEAYLAAIAAEQVGRDPNPERMAHHRGLLAIHEPLDD